MTPTMKRAESHAPVATCSSSSATALWNPPMQLMSTSVSLDSLNSSPRRHHDLSRKCLGQYCPPPPHTACHTTTDRCLWCASCKSVASHFVGPYTRFVGKPATACRPHRYRVV